MTNTDDTKRTGAKPDPPTTRQPKDRAPNRHRTPTSGRPAGERGSKISAPKSRPTKAARKPRRTPLPYRGGPTLVFEVAGQRYGLPVEHVVRIIEMVALTPLPEASPSVVGVINFHGRVVPVVDLRRRLRLPPQPYRLRTPIVISQMGEHYTGLIVEAVQGVVELPLEQTAVPAQIFPRQALPPPPLLAGVGQTKDGLLLILDLAAFLSSEEEERSFQTLSPPQG